MSSVIQLSFLGWVHEETTLAATLVENMLKRYESRVQGATPDPDYDGILKTLQVCSSQTSQYRWDNLVSLVEDRFQKSTQWLRPDNNPLRSLKPSLLLGAMDYLYMTQSLPEDRFIMVESQIGLIPIVVWARYILGLTVLIKDSPDGDVIFGCMRNPQVIINWSLTSLSFSEMLIPGLLKRELSPPTMYLLDAGMHVLLKTEASDNEGTIIEGQECHRLKGYGTTFLQRLFNRETLIADDDPIYAETANFAVSFAILLSRVMRRVPNSIQSGREEDEEIDLPSQYYLGTEHWRLFDSSYLLFWGIKLDKRKISEHVDRLSGNDIEDMAVPTSIRNYLQKLTEVIKEYEYRYSKKNYLRDIKQLASWILSYAQVVNIELCADFPLRITAAPMFCTGVQSWNGLEPIKVESDVFFKLIMMMMICKATTKRSPTVDSEGLFLTCHQGWSLFYNSVGDYDPGDINCELLSIKRGVPTNTRTGERKYRIADAPSHIQRGVDTPRGFDRGGSYIPRCVSKVHKRTEHYSSRSDEFWLSIRFDIEETDFYRRTPDQMATQDQRYSLYGSYSRFHQNLWAVLRTIPCPHGDEACGPLPLDLDARTVLGLTWANACDESISDARICICLVKGDARARWLVVYGAIAKSSMGVTNLGRRLLLRCDDCCEDCSVKAASAMKGDWLVIL